VHRAAPAGSRDPPPQPHPRSPQRPAVTVASQSPSPPLQRLRRPPRARTTSAPPRKAHRHRQNQWPDSPTTTADLLPLRSNKTDALIENVLSYCRNLPFCHILHCQNSPAVVYNLRRRRSFTIRKAPSSSPSRQLGCPGRHRVHILMLRSATASQSTPSHIKKSKLDMRQGCPPQVFVILRLNADPRATPLIPSPSPLPQQARSMSEAMEPVLVSQRMPIWPSSAWKPATRKIIVHRRRSSPSLKQEACRSWSFRIYPLTPITTTSLPSPEARNHAANDARDEATSAPAFRLTLIRADPPLASPDLNRRSPVSYRRGTSSSAPMMPIPSDRLLGRSPPFRSPYIEPDAKASPPPTRSCHMQTYSLVGA